MDKTEANHKLLRIKSGYKQTHHKQVVKDCLYPLNQAYEELMAICTKFQDEFGATDMEVKTLLRELAKVYEKDVDDD